MDEEEKSGMDIYGILKKSMAHRSSTPDFNEMHGVFRKLGLLFFKFQETLRKIQIYAN